MLVSEIKDKFFTLVDEFATQYFDDDKLNQFFGTSQTEVFEDFMAKYQLTNAITENILPLVLVETVTTGTPYINLNIDLTEPYLRLITVTPKYVEGGKTYEYTAEQRFAEEKNAVYSKGTLRYPRYDQKAATKGDALLTVYPTEYNPTEVEINYFRKPYTIDFNSPSTDIPYPPMTIEMIINKSLQLAASTMREQVYYNTETQLLTAQKTSQQ